MIIQINIFICEECEKVVTIKKDGLDMYSDPIIKLEGWNYSEVNDRLLCEECYKEEFEKI